MIIFGALYTDLKFCKNLSRDHFLLLISCGKTEMNDFFSTCDSFFSLIFYCKFCSNFYCYASLEKILFVYINIILRIFLENLFERLLKFLELVKCVIF